VGAKTLAHVYQQKPLAAQIQRGTYLNRISAFMNKTLAQGCLTPVFLRVFFGKPKRLGNKKKESCCVFKLS